MYFVRLHSVPNKYGSPLKGSTSSAHLPNAALLLTQIFTEYPLYAGYSACLIGGGNRRYSLCFWGTYCPDGEKDVFYKLEGKFNLDEDVGDFYRASV